VAKDNDTYALIMKDKERLLSLDEPLQFIFSHSALREGWDNPNVFQICTLNESVSVDKKRQEIGRGLRLCVNQAGERIHDKRVNVLTVIPNQSYEAFAQSLQSEIEEDTGVTFDKRNIKDGRAKAIVKRQQLSDADEAIFKAIWDKISYETRYSVRVNTPQLIQDAVAALQDLTQYPAVAAPKIRAAKARLVMRTDGVHGVANGTGQSEVHGAAVGVPDVYAYIQNRVHVSRSTIFAILQGSGRMGELLVNPQAFLDLFVAVVQRTLRTMQVEGIEYHLINGKRYEMSLFDEPIETYLSGVYPPALDDLTEPLRKTVFEAQVLDKDTKTPTGEAFACVLTDSDVESQFAQDCSHDERVKFFFKLPSQFKISTPLGHYNPDWAVVLESETAEPLQVYFVVETKSSTVEADRRADENFKIACGRAHFGLADVGYAVVASLPQLRTQTEM
jgi:type III restriction enzyme